MSHAELSGFSSGYRGVWLPEEHLNTDIKLNSLKYTLVAYPDYQGLLALHSAVLHLTSK